MIILKSYAHRSDKDTELRLLSKLIITVASLVTTPTYNIILNTVIHSLVRPAHD